MAKTFLYFIAICIVVIIAGRIGYELFDDELAEIALVPTADFTPTEPLEVNAYQDPALWYSRPGIGVKDPARWQPAFAPESVAPVEPDEDARERVLSTDQPDFAVFFVHPTSYLSRDSWNMPLAADGEADAAVAEAERVSRIYLRGMASPFNAASEIWAPRYRQATMGAFLTDSDKARQAIDAAYSDVREAYRFFLDSIGSDTPIVLAGHSQGALHLTRLLKEEVKGTNAAGRLVAAYAIGWPISVDHDLPAMGIAACATPRQTACVLSWSSFAEPADFSDVIETYAASEAFDGEMRGESMILCTNPLTGTFGGEAPASDNLGTLVPDDTMSSGELVPGSVPARCGDNGLLMIGDPPELGSYVLPGNNYHLYDIPLFWANTKVDVARRVQAMVSAGGGNSDAQDAGDGDGAS